MSANHRLATVKATGKQYLVSFIDFRTNKVVCHGEVTRALGLKSWHDANQAFLLSEVTITEVIKTEALVEALWRQRLAGLQAEGQSIEIKRSRKGNLSARRF